VDINNSMINEAKLKEPSKDQTYLVQRWNKLIALRFRVLLMFNDILSQRRKTTRYVECYN